MRTMDIIDLAEQNKINRIFLARNKLNFTGAISHLTQHSCGSEPLFLEDSDYLYFLGQLKDCAKKFELDVFALCLMSNHLHLLLRINKVNLPKAMQNLFQSYARYFNKKYSRKGHVFCGAFRQSLCLDDSYALAASIYIHLNPYKAGLAGAEKPYRWSSLNLYVDNMNKETFVRYEYLLRPLAADLENARSIYQRLLSSMLSVEVNISRGGKADLVSFRAKLLKSLRIVIGEEGDIAASKGMLADKEIEAYLEKMEGKQRLRSPQDIKAREFLIKQLRANGYKIGEIAAILGQSRVTISKAFNLTK